MSDPERYASVAERITWTSGFRVLTDKHVLGKLSTFANFKTGKRADMSLDSLMHRANVKRRTLIRALQRLEADGWIVGRRRHRRPTVYDICVERLATHWREVTLITPKPLGATGGTQETERVDPAVLSATGDRLSATGGTQKPVLSATGGTPSPVRTDPQEDPQRTGTTPQQLSLGPEDVSPSPGPAQFDAAPTVAAIRERLTTAPPFETRHQRRQKHG